MNVSWTWPEMTSPTDCGVPRYGTCVMVVPEATLNAAIAMCAAPPVPGGTEIQLAGVGRGVIDQLPNGMHRHRWIDHDDIRHHRQRRDVGERQRVVLQIGIEARIDRQDADVTEQQRVAVRRGARDRGRADGAAGAWPVVDDHRPAEDRRDLICDRPRQDVGQAAGRERHDEAMFEDGHAGCASARRGTSEAAAAIAAGAKPRTSRRRSDALLRSNGGQVGNGA